MPGKNSVTIYDISQKAGVSIATVSRVINASPNVNSETKERVLAVMAECEYTPNAFARGLGLNTMKTIGILCADSSDIYLAKAVYHIEQRLRQKQYDSILCCTGYELENKKKCLSLLLSKKVDSVILVGSNFIEKSEADNAYIREAASAMPIMLLNASYEHDNVYSIFCDDADSMERVSSKLIKSGRQNILYLYNSHSYSGIRKLEGFMKGYENYGLKPNPNLIQMYLGSRENIADCAQYVKNIYKKICPFDAVVASEDNLAVAAIKACNILHLSIPKDVAIVGYNNSIITALSSPELSSVDNKLETLCENLVDTLMGVLEGKEMPKKIVFSGELIERETT